MTNSRSDSRTVGGAQPGFLKVTEFGSKKQIRFRTAAGAPPPHRYMGNPGATFMNGCQTEGVWTLGPGPRAPPPPAGPLPESGAEPENVNKKTIL